MGETLYEGLEYEGPDPNFSWGPSDERPLLDRIRWLLPWNMILRKPPIGHVYDKAGTYTVNIK